MVFTFERSTGRALCGLAGMLPACLLLGAALLPETSAQTAAPGPGLGRPQVISTSSQHLRHFGFALVDAGFDDPLDAEVKTNYSDEVASFSTMAHVAVVSPSDPLQARLGQLNGLGMKAVLDVSSLFFVVIPDATTGSGSRLVLRADAYQRWQLFLFVNGTVVGTDTTAALYLADEPTWNGLPAADLQSVAGWVQASHPLVPSLVIEASAALDALVVPPEVDWLGFDRYGVLDPGSDPAYLADMATLRARLSSPQQRLVIVMETQWLSIYGTLGVSPSDMGGVAYNTWFYAENQPDVVALIGYLWPGGFDAPDQLGARELPTSVQDIYQQIGDVIGGG